MYTSSVNLWQNKLQKLGKKNYLLVVWRDLQRKVEWDFKKYILKYRYDLLQVASKWK